MTSDTLEFLVKIAAAGTSGVCVLCVAAAGYLLLNLPEPISKNRVHVLRLFMKNTALIAIVSALTSGFATYWDYRTKVELEKKVEQLANVVSEKTLDLEKSQLYASNLSEELESKDERVISLEQEADRLRLNNINKEQKLANLAKDLEQAEINRKKLAATLESFREIPPYAEPPQER